MPRFLFLFVSLAAVFWPDATIAQSYYQGRWCAVVSQGLGVVREICHFRSFESCRLEVVSGNRGFCRQSQYWSGGHDAPRKSPRKRTRR